MSKKKKVKASKKKKSVWMKDPEVHNYDAAYDYLDLHLPKERVEQLVEGLKNTKTIHKKAKDVLRASGLTLLTADNIHVKSNLKKFKKGKLLSPVLLVRGENKLYIADGFHRISAAYILSEDLEIRCRII